MKIDSDVVTLLLCNVCNAKCNLLFNGLHLSTHTPTNASGVAWSFNKIVEHGTRTLEDADTGMELLTFQLAGRQHTLLPEAPTKLR